MEYARLHSISGKGTISNLYNFASQDTSAEITHLRNRLLDAVFAPYCERKNLFTQSADESAKMDKIFSTYYFPTFICLKSSYENHVNTNRKQKPLFVGMSAPQGCGKTTFTEVMSEMFAHVNLNCVAMSLDDFYLTGELQDKLAYEHAENPLLQYRGNAGTHDLQLAINTLEALKTASPKSPAYVPRYDKSLRLGRGDRAPPSNWLKIEQTVDIVIFEGWMLGFTAEKDQNTKADNTGTKVIVPEGVPMKGIEEVDRRLSDYGRLHYMFDFWILLALEGVAQVFEWRLQAERKMVAGGKPGLTDEQVRDFVLRFMPAYVKYLPYLYTSGPQRKPDAPTLQVWETCILDMAT